MRGVWILLAFLILSSAPGLSVSASSSGDEDAPPQAGNPGGGGGGGSPNFFDYYIPLVFNGSHKDGQSEIALYTLFPTLLITSFAQNSIGTNFAQLQEPTKIVFNPTDNFGLTNGSLIRTTSPVQIVGQRSTEDIFTDSSFGYSILPRRMMGFEYFAPFDGEISILSLDPGAEVQIQSLSGSHRVEVLSLPARPVSISISKGDYINSSYPTLGAFYSDTEEGMSASMAVPRYLQGSNYYFDSSISSLRPDEVELSYLSINPSQPTEAKFYFANGKTEILEIFEPIEIELDPLLRGFNLTRGVAEANIRIKTAYGGLIRSSTIQLMSIDEMRAGELFLTPSQYSSHFSLSGEDTKFNFSRYDYEVSDYVVESRESEIGFIRQAISVNSLEDSQFILATDELFGMAISPGKVGHPMSPSSSFVLLPLNSQSFKNITGLSGTWYRFANLAVTSVSVIPGPVEEYTGQIIQIIITANGTLPASTFRIEVSLNDEVVIDERYDFLQVNDTIEYNIREFVPYRQESMSVSVMVDIDNEVTEINEEDNETEETFEVQANIRLRVTVVLAVLTISGLIVARIRRFFKQRTAITRAHVDAILTFEEVDE